MKERMNSYNVEEISLKIQSNKAEKIKEIEELHKGADFIFYSDRVIRVKSTEIKVFENLCAKKGIELEWFKVFARNNQFKMGKSWKDITEYI